MSRCTRVPLSADRTTIGRSEVLASSTTSGPVAPARACVRNSALTSKATPEPSYHAGTRVSPTSTEPGVKVTVQHGAPTAVDVFQSLHQGLGLGVHVVHRRVERRREPVAAARGEASQRLREVLRLVVQRFGLVHHRERAPFRERATVRERREDLDEAGPRVITRDRALADPLGEAGADQARSR
jgi:hypothetical protein